MPRVKPLPDAQTPSETKAAYTQHKTVYNARITNMKATLGHSLPAFRAYMEWYPLYEEVKIILGKRLSPLFAWSISEASDCPLCSTFFRKIIKEAGEDPENLVLTDEEQSILSFGAAVAKNKGYVSNEIYHPIREKFTDKEIVVLTAFAGIMIATNIFNNVNLTEIDEYLHPYLADRDLTHIR